ncbi:MAG: hypothetical protein AAGL24_12345 [Pseudomonadota bacterium]
MSETGNGRFSFGKVVGTIAAVLTIIVSVIALWDRIFLVEEDTPEPLPQSEIIQLTDLSELEQEVAGQIQLLLVSSGCSDAKLLKVEASAQRTPAEQSHSGFDGYFLEGSATLSVGDKIRKIRLVGNGKGPAAQGNAITMASKEFLNMVNNDSSLNVHCDY